MSGMASRAHSLGPGAVVVRGGGAAGAMLARHLGPDLDIGTIGMVEIDLVDDAGDGPGVQLRGRRGVARVEDGDPVIVTWERHVTTMRPLVVGAHLAARRRRGVLLQGAAVRWNDGPAVVFAGSGGVGKTGAMLAAVADGATPLGADWSWVDVDDGRLWALPQPVRVRPHHLASAPLRGHISQWRRLVMTVGGRMPRPVSSRSYVDVPLAQLGGGPADPAPLGAILVLGAGTEFRVASLTADQLAGTTSDDLVAALPSRVPVLHIGASGPLDAVDAARQAVS